MIKKIFIKDYILIDELEVEFHKGLNIITGETGAGKSILINAIDIAFGARVMKDVVKNGAQKALIELTIANSHDLKDLFVEAGIDDLGDEIILSREITSSGSRCRVNGTLVNQDFIKSLKETFLDIHSQHQTYAFLQQKHHINLLDSYEKDSYGSLLDEYCETYKSLLSLHKKLEAAQSANNATEAQIDFLKFQINEIDEARITDANEYDELKSKLVVLENAEKLKELCESSYWTINGEDNSIVDALLSVKNNVSKAVKTDSELESVEQSIIDAYETLREAASELRNYASSLDNDTEALNRIQERIFLLDKLKRKYGPELSDVLSTYDKLSEEFNLIELSSQGVEALEKEINSTISTLTELSEKLSQLRKIQAAKLSELVENRLRNLELPKVKFEIEVAKTELGPNGADRVEFLISTNVSQTLAPLNKVASGGEISRVMLAIKTVFAQVDELDTVIFDEIDTGISGKAAQSVAEEISELSLSKQIILITHQAIVASKADRHFYLSKTQDDITTVHINILSGDEKIKAIAELAGGDVNDKSLDFARALVNN